MAHVTRPRRCHDHREAELRIVTSESHMGLADFSACGCYRYVLARQLDGDPLQRVCLFVMLNPSTADALKDDPTIRRCITFARGWGYSRLRVVNLFAYRSSRPRELRDVACPNGPHNVEYLANELGYADLVVCAWGNGGGLDVRRPSYQFRRFAAELGQTVHHLGITQQGQPKHPLARGAHRIPDDVVPRVWKF